MGVLAANPQGLPAQNSARDIGAAPQSAAPVGAAAEPALISGDAPVNIVPRTRPTEEAAPAPLPKGYIRVDTNVVLVPVTFCEHLFISKQSHLV